MQNLVVLSVSSFRHTSVTFIRKLGLESLAMVMRSPGAHKPAAEAVQARRLKACRTALQAQAYWAVQKPLLEASWIYSFALCRQLLHSEGFAAICLGHKLVSLVLDKACFASVRKYTAR